MIFDVVHIIVDVKKFVLMRMVGGRTSAPLSPVLFCRGWVWIGGSLITQAPHPSQSSLIGHLVVLAAHICEFVITGVSLFFR